MKPTSEYVPDWRGAPTFPAATEPLSPPDVEVALYPVADVEQLVAEHAAMSNRIRRDDRALNVLGALALMWFGVRAFIWARDAGLIG